MLDPKTAIKHCVAADVCGYCDPKVKKQKKSGIRSNVHDMPCNKTIQRKT